MNPLSIQHGIIADPAGQPVHLRGVNIGGYLNMEHFLNGHSGAEVNLRRTMAQILGAGKADFFFDRLLHHFFNEADVAFLKSCGVTAIRLPLNYRHFESDAAPFEYLESGFARLDQVLGWCEAHGIYVILDLHSVQGWQNGDWHSDNSSRHALFFTQKHYQDRFYALWAEFGRRYKDHAVVAAYNLMNEPLANAPYGRFSPDEDYIHDWDNLNRIYRLTVEAIRAVDPAKIIIIEGDYYSTRFSGLDAPSDPNLMVSNHNYIPAAIDPIQQYPVTLGDTLWDRAYIEKQFAETEGYQFARQHNVPLLVGEFGLSMDYPAPNVRHKVAVLYDQMDSYNALGCHWTFWSYKALGSMGWVQTHPDSLYNHTIAPVLAGKAELGVDFGWLGGFSPAVQPHMTGLSEAIRAHMPYLNEQSNFRYLAQAAMSCYAADQLQTLYARQFADKTETQIDAILSSFAFASCIERIEMSLVIREAALQPA